MYNIQHNITVPVLYNNILYWCNLTFTIIFILEAILKIIAYGKAKNHKTHNLYRKCESTCDSVRIANKMLVKNDGFRGATHVIKT